MRYVARAVEKRFRSLLRSFPSVVVLGPRQCGKSTFVRHALPQWRYIDLERPADRDLLEADLEGFFDAYPRQVIIDEAQRMPELLPLLRHVIDRDQTKGRFVLLGSASPQLTMGASESLAGRVGMLELTPFRGSEVANSRHARNRWFHGGYPPVHGLRSFDAREDWLDSYVTTFLERDVPALGLNLPAARLRKLWTMLTHVHGNLLNVSDLARSLAVSTHTVNHYLDVLEGAYLIRRLAPLHVNLQKRLTKSPKVYIRDTGVLHFLAGLRHPTDLETWPKRGHSFEGLVVEEIAALADQHLVRPELCFWRTHAGAEVDLVLHHRGTWVPIEIKLGAAVDHYAVAGLRQFMKDLEVSKGWVVAKTTERRRLGENIEIVPWEDVVNGREDFGIGQRRGRTKRRNDGLR